MIVDRGGESALRISTRIKLHDLQIDKQRFEPFLWSRMRNIAEKLSETK
jgi:hypothetical protein